MVESIRRFNRFYARALGIFNNKYLDADYTPTEVRIIGEIGRNPGITAKEIAGYLALDKSYLSREIRKLADDALILRKRSSDDARSFPLYLTEKGEALNAELDVRANRRIESQIRDLPDGERRDLVAAMARIEQILSGAVEESIRP